jgi:predicted DCC family thiol-disulfide oxidoreductase YuxK
VASLAFLRTVVRSLPLRRYAGPASSASPPSIRTSSTIAVRNYVRATTADEQSSVEDIVSSPSRSSHRIENVRQIRPEPIHARMDYPVLVYDDECGFCTFCADLLENYADYDILGYAKLSDDLRDRLPEDYERSSHFVTEDEVFSDGASIEQAVVASEYGGEVEPLVDFVRQFEDYAQLRDEVYEWVADNRDLMGKIASQRPPALDDDEDRTC